VAAWTSDGKWLHSSGLIAVQGISGSGMGEEDERGGGSAVKAEMRGGEGSWELEEEGNMKSGLLHVQHKRRSCDRARSRNKAPSGGWQKAITALHHGRRRRRREKKKPNGSAQPFLRTGKKKAKLRPRRQRGFVLQQPKPILLLARKVNPGRSKRIKFFAKRFAARNPPSKERGNDEIEGGYLKKG